MQARSAVQCRSARLSEAVSPAKSARVAIGLIVVKSVAKSLLILIKSGDICRSVSFILIRMTYQARAKLLRSASRDRTREMILPIHAFLSRHSFSTRRSLVRRLVSVGGSLIRTADQARGKVGVVKWACVYGVAASAQMEARAKLVTPFTRRRVRSSF